VEETESMMYKIAGSVKYPFGAISPSDTSGYGLGFMTQEAAQLHADNMNKLCDSYGDDITWNADVWKTKPEPWIVFSAV
jgi:hypothetical protein